MININFSRANYDYVFSPYMDMIGDIGNLFWHLCDEKIDSSKWNYDEIYALNEINQKTIITNETLEIDIPVMLPRRLARELREVL